jgi:hypothetical protein
MLMTFEESAESQGSSPMGSAGVPPAVAQGQINRGGPMLLRPNVPAQGHGLGVKKPESGATLARPRVLMPEGAAGVPSSWTTASGGLPRPANLLFTRPPVRPGEEEVRDYSLDSNVDLLSGPLVYRPV